eukprot:212458-Amphidinium_carterae.2
MALLMQHIQGDIRPHLLLNVNLAAADIDNAATKVEEYYRNVYIDNNNPGGIQAFDKGVKPWKGKGKDKDKKGGKYYYKGKGQYYQQRQPYKPWKRKGKGGKYGGQRPYYSKSKGKARVITTTRTTHDPKEVTTIAGKTKEK